MYAYIEASTGTVHGVATNDISLAEYQSRFPGVPVDERRDDAPDDAKGCESGSSVYMRWTGSGYETIENLDYYKTTKNGKIDARTRELFMLGLPGFSSYADVQAIIDSGTALTDVVNAATTRAEVDAVVDDR